RLPGTRPGRSRLTPGDGLTRRRPRAGSRPRRGLRAQVILLSTDRRHMLLVTIVRDDRRIFEEWHRTCAMRNHLMTISSRDWFPAFRICVLTPRRSAD